MDKVTSPGHRLAVVVSVLVLPFGVYGKSVSSSSSEEGAMISFAITELKSALEKAGHILKDAQGDVEILLSMDSRALKAQAFTIRVKENKIHVTGGDQPGLMYGTLDLAETITTDGLAGVRDKDEEPYLEKRGLKMNIPLDARTPAYSDAGTAAQENIPVLWDMSFWKDHLDMLARHRYNVVSLWNMHPFPSMVRVHEYPDVALNDVMRADLGHDEWIKFNRKFHPRGTNMVNRTIEANLTVVKKMTPDEKIAFWRDVMRYAHGRGIEFYVITWNTFTWGATGKHGIEQNTESNITKDYIRKSVKAMFDTYPLLAGIGVTAGENMHKIGKADKEKWLWDTYGQGVMDHLDTNPTQIERSALFTGIGGQTLTKL